MAIPKLLERFSPTPPPFAASKELREWLRDELDRLTQVTNGMLEVVDAISAVPSMYLGGDADDFNLDTIDSQFVNYTLDAALGRVPIEPDPVAGEITVPIAGAYTLVAYCFGQQPSVTQNQTIRLLVAVNGTPTIVATLDVLSNQTDDRTLTATFTRVFAKDDIVTMLLDATADLGVFNVQQTALEMTFQTLDDVQQAQAQNINLNWT